ncbi:nicotinate-nucleotide--dimethylbenzimidazole phosphoribosyltransferase [Streptomyces olivaceus]|uniref:nicotinate-nucleotide--dimethylbenzimidazole phosphoribosyltransferase n=1 Tax=Streptomyces olivaceus TaxID=47716 RepID=UPI001CCE27D4|nr:nicotinate-nucleotide--dimethylbenzimidazole phosphoribosyltransferase [Streptomyces olivaceus]MBZ6287053.1 nicotinate-nucleotide--dimethylbenzimidazole phosphoribosyltransferase [Streptomyces olivaceus]
MTDTGQIPGEGLPENAGMVEQPGVPAPGAYTYLSEADAEDEDLLLLPGAQSAWGNEVAPPAPEPVVETVHQPGPHELSGRDSGSVDLGGVRLPDPASAPVQPRRPLHLGPPIPDASASPVRSLADRGPAAAPVRHPGPPAAVPEYLDAPQAAAMPPQSAAPWGVQAAPQTAPAPASAGAGDAETVVPVPDQEPEPLGAAQALVSRVATEAVTATGGAEEPGQAGAGLAEAPEPTAGEGHEAPQPQEFPGQQVAADGTEGAEEGVAAQAAGGVAPQAPPAQDAPAPQGAGIPAPQASPEAPLPEPPVAQDDQSADAPAPAGPPSAPADTLTPEATAPDTVVDPAAPDAADTADAASAGAPVGVAPSAPDAVAPEAVAPDAVVAGAVGEEAVAPEAVAPGVVAPEAVGPGTAAPEAVGPDVAVPGAVAPEAAEPQPAGPEQSPEPGAAEVPDRPEPVADADVQPRPPVPSAPQETAAVQPDSAPSPEAATARPDAQPGADQPVVEHAPADHAVAGQAVPGQYAPGEPVAQADPQEAVPQAIAPQEVAPEPDGFDASADAGPDTPVVTDTTAGTETLAAPEPPVVPEPAPGPRSDAHLTAEHPPAPDAPRPAQGPQSLVGTDVPDVPQEVAVAPSTSEPAEPDAAPAPTAEQQPLPEPPQGAGEPGADEVEAQFPPVEGGQVPTTPAGPEAVPVTPEVPAPRETGPELAQNADDLATRAADQEDEADQILVDVPEVRRPTGPAAPAYDDAERAAVLKVMRERRDIRNGFRSDPIPHEVLLRVLEAAHTAPSVGHSQPWDFVVIRSEDTRRAMHELAMRQRDAYAKSLPKGRAKQFKELKIEAILDTPVNIVVTADPTRGGRHTLGRHTQPQMAPYSSALAVENLWLAARAEGLGVGWVSFFDEREMVRALGLPEHLDIVAYLCVGYVDEFPDEPELMQAGWSKRRPLSWVVHEETYGRRALPGEAPHDLLAETVAQIRPLDAKALGEAWERQKRMTKPAGALGMLEIISAQLSGLSRQCPPPIPEPAAVAVFAGDHGVHAQGVTPWPQEVTAQMVANFLGGGAVCNAFATQVGAEVCVVDVGVATDLPATPGLLPRKIRGGTSDMTTGPAMTREEAKQAVEVGIETARDLVAAGNKALLTGEMGIANTTASAALISVFTGVDPAEVTGRGTGINDETLARKTEVVRRALELHQPDPADPVGVLAAVGGFEHAAMVGLLLGGASLRTPVILDGVSAGAAALVARAIAPEVLAACIAGHRSAEPGHVAALNKLGLRPLVDLDLRLGEGTGALLALPMVQSTARAMHEVATFDSAGVTEK